MPRVKQLTIKDYPGIALNYSRERDDTYLPAVNGVLPYNPHAKQECYYLMFNGSRITDYMTKEDALELKNEMYRSLFFSGAIQVTFKDTFYDRDSIITACAIEQKGYENDVVVTNQDGDTYVLLSYFPDEVSFYPQEFIGRTGNEGLQLFDRKDVAYLRS